MKSLVGRFTQRTVSQITLKKWMLRDMFPAASPYVWFSCKKNEKINLKHIRFSLIKSQNDGWRKNKVLCGQAGLSTFFLNSSICVSETTHSILMPSLSLCLLTFQRVGDLLIQNLWVPILNWNNKILNNDDINILI